MLPDYVTIGRDQYPADRVGADGRPLHITQEQAAAICEVLADEFETNPVFREFVRQRAPRQSDGCGDRGEAA